jgi:hypothetical protein
MSFGITHFCCSKKKVGKVCGPIDKFLTPLCSTSVSGRMDDGYWFILSICATVNTAHCSICMYTYLYLGQPTDMVIKKGDVA